MHKQKLLAVICVAALVGANAGIVRAEDNDAQTKAREALRQAVQDSGSQPVVTPPKKATPVVPVQPAPPVADAPASNKPEGLTSDQEEKVRAAIRAEKARLDAADKAAAVAKTQKQNPAKPVSTAVAVQATTKPEPKKVSVVTTVKPLPAKTGASSVSPAPSSKEQKLHDLLQLYKADKITPDEYHQERAKILAE